MPTLVTYEALSEEGKSYNVPENVIRKIDEAREVGIRALRYAYEAGVKIASGSDLLGPLHVRKSRELEIKTEVMTPMESLISANTNAELFSMQNEIGTVEEGKLADLLVVEGSLGRHLRVPEAKQPEAHHEGRQGGQGHAEE